MLERINSTQSFWTAMRDKKSSKCLFLPDPTFDKAETRHGSNLATAVVNCVLFPVAILFNSLVLYVICKKPSLRRPSNIFIGCLALSDLLVGLVVQPSYVAYRLGENSSNFVSCAIRMTYSFGFYICYGISFMTLSAVSCERYIALRLHLRYNEIVTTARVFKVISLIWILDILLTLFQFFGLIDTHNNTIIRATQLGLWMICLVMTCVVSLKTLKIVQRHRQQIAYVQKITCPSNGTGAYLSQAKIAISVAYIVGVYILFNLPVLMVTIYHQLAKGEMSYNVYSWTETIAFLNSSLNPVVCCWKHSEIRRHVLKIFENVSCLRKPATVINEEAVALSVLQGKSTSSSV